MLYFKCKLTNLWTKNNFKNLFSSTGHLFGHKYWEFQILRDYTDLLGLEINTHYRGHDHAGFSITVTVLCHSVEFLVYDHRHWNFDTNTWLSPEDEDAYFNTDKQEESINDIDKYNGC